MKCPKGTPWTWCLNKRCTVDPIPGVPEHLEAKLQSSLVGQ